MEDRRVPFAEVLAAAQANAGWAFRRLFDELARPVVGYLRLQGACDPDDLANEAFLGAFSNIDRFEGDEEAFRSWVFTIAHHRLVDERRRLSRRPALAGHDADADVRGGDVEDDALRSAGDERVREVLALLAPDQRDVLLLRIVGDHTVEQVAEALGKTPGAVKALQRRGLRALRKEISREGVPL
ncbi:MAG: sigma-70 family RNA polymerase sigma factor [Actinomycetota bacterium]|nr:sigma-70 family RNA polymerase sigma factor [Actinomycetota bacterium]